MKIYSAVLEFLLADRWGEANGCILQLLVMNVTGNHIRKKSKMHGVYQYRMNGGITQVPTLLEKDSS
jgi:hypothetical protein